MKKSIMLTTIIFLAVLAGGCGSNEIIRVGTPFQNDGTTGVEFHTDITDSEAMTDLRTVIEMEEETEKPENLTREPDTFFKLDRPEEGVSEIRRYVWYLEDGSSVLSSDESGQEFFTLTEEQTTDLKSIIE